MQTSHFHGKIRSSLKGPLLDDIEVAKYKRHEGYQMRKYLTGGIRGPFVARPLKMELVIASFSGHVLKYPTAALMP